MAEVWARGRMGWLEATPGESATHFERRFRDALSARRLNRKVRPALSVYSGMQFPPVAQPETTTRFSAE